MPIITRVSSGSFWKWVVLLQALKMGNATSYANKKWIACSDNKTIFNKLVRPRWPYDMRPSVRAEKYIRDAGP